MAREKRVLNSICHILLLFGIAFIILGVILSDRRQPLASLLDVNISPVFLVGVLSICIGGFTFLLTVLGLYGSIKERRLALFLFMIALVISAVIQVANIYFALIYSSSIRITIEDGLLLKMYLYSPNANRTETDFVRTWDFTQQKDGCCGVLSPADWGNFSYFVDNTYPDSCCRNMTNECGLRGETDIYSEVNRLKTLPLRVISWDSSLLTRR
ncbi:hypothetical protein BSL78_08883 [Apostichopus japonicus]|uniref:Tetraspanin n=1 Tax=Stichopus japonicus TaxID=307972 RepID=A0A2G8L1S1_STIJA|nr:hypothetical protein BSL78_08883 [Apostichopus japonicus]